jgi:hypothetical protein
MECWSAKATGPFIFRRVFSDYSGTSKPDTIGRFVSCDGSEFSMNRMEMSFLVMKTKSEIAATSGLGKRQADLVSGEDGEDYRKRIASTVPVATITLRTSSASNSDRSSLMVQA